MVTNKEIMKNWQLPENVGYGRINEALDDARADAVRKRRKSKKTYTQNERAFLLYATYKNRLRGKPNPFNIDSFREFVSPFYNSPCKYCKEILTPQNISLDHELPISRGGSVEMGNLCLICKRCNRRKGELTKEEYLALLHFLRAFPDMEKILLKRLSAAGFMFFKRKG